MGVKNGHVQRWDNALWVGIVILVLVSMAGCSQSARTIGLSDLEDPDPAIRIQAIKWAGENKVEQATPILVDRLQEQDESVRFFAISALERITGTDHGFDYKADAASRADAVQRWRQALGQPAGKTTP